MKRVLGLLSVALVAWTPNPLTPDRSHCNLDNTQAATFRKAFAAGKLSQIELRHKVAITQFKRAYEICDSPQLLAFIANSYKAQGNKKFARRYQKAYQNTIKPKSAPKAAPTSRQRARTKTQRITPLPLEVATKRTSSGQELIDVKAASDELQLLPILQLPDGQSVRTVPSNIPANQRASLTITTDPEGAWVFIYPDLKRPVAMTPTKNIPLQSKKSYRMFVYKNGYKTVDKTIQLNTNTKLHILLDPKKPQINSLRLAVPP